MINIEREIAPDLKISKKSKKITDSLFFPSLVEIALYLFLIKGAGHPLFVWLKTKFYTCSDFQFSARTVSEEY